MKFPLKAQMENKISEISLCLPGASASFDPETWALSLTQGLVSSVWVGGGDLFATPAFANLRIKLWHFFQPREGHKGLGFWTGVSHFKKPTYSKNKKYANQTKLEVIQSFVKEDSPCGFLIIRSIIYLICCIVHKTKNQKVFTCTISGTLII